jgi:sortase B
MKKVWNLAAKLASGGDRLLNVAIALMMIVALLFGGYGLWDTWNIYNNAGVATDLLKYRPTITEEDTPNPTLSDLQKINPDVCAWLVVDDTNIDYPVVQGETNLEYLNRAVDGSFALSGSLFLDCYNSRDFSDCYSLIYGHHIEGDVMFGELTNFLKSEYFQSHTSGTLCTPEHTRRIQWFACMKTDAYDTQMYNTTACYNQKTMAVMLDYIKNNSIQYREIGVSASDQIIALSTCLDTTTNGRVILIGRLS